jgi:hypothetical protein
VFLFELVKNLVSRIEPQVIHVLVTLLQKRIGLLPTGDGKEGEGTDEDKRQTIWA